MNAACVLEKEERQSCTFLMEVGEERQILLNTGCIRIVVFLSRFLEIPYNLTRHTAHACSIAFTRSSQHSIERGTVPLPRTSILTRERVKNVQH